MDFLSHLTNMMHRTLLTLSLLIAIASVGCTESDPTSPPPFDIAAHRDGEIDLTRFVGIDVNSLTDRDRAILVMASTDFSRVVSGDEPLHATAGKIRSALADGGTSFYVGNFYRLTIVKKISSNGTFRGYLYGPVLTFDESFPVGNQWEISDLRIYSFEELDKLLEK